MIPVNPLTNDERRRFAQTLRAAADAVERGDDEAMGNHMAEGAEIVLEAAVRRAKESGRAVVINPGELNPIAKA